MKFLAVYYNKWTIPGDADFECMVFNWLLSDMCETLSEMKEATMLEF